MTVDLHTLAAKVSATANPNIRAWMDAVDDILQPVAPPPPPTPIPTPPPSGSQWWDATQAALDPSSKQYISTWLGGGAPSAQVILGDWAVATATAKNGDPSYSIPLTKQGGSLTIRCPQGAKPATPLMGSSGGSDAHLAIDDPDAGTQTDLWQAIYDSTTGRIKSASAGVTFKRGSVNEATGGWGGNAANLALLPYLVRPEEIKAGVIAHPLSFAIPVCGPGPFRYPALHVGNWPDTGHLSAGFWLRLDPAADLSGLSGTERMIAVALQRYGMFLRDRGGGANSLTIYGENTINSGVAWSAVGVSGSSIRLPGVPWSKMQLIQPPAKP